MEMVVAGEKKQYDVLDVASNLADLRYLDVAFFRENGFDWVMQIKFSDSNGPYSAYIHLPREIEADDKEKKPGTRHMTESGLRRLISKVCAQAHAKRAPKKPTVRVA